MGACTKTMPYTTAETFVQAPYGEAVPFGDPNWYQGWASPYYKPTHHRFRAQVREFVETELMPNCNEWDEAKRIPAEVFEKAFQAGWLPCVVGAPWPREFTGDLEPPEDYDYFHELIAIDEVARCGAGGVLWGLFEGLQIGLPPVLNHGTQAQKDLCCADCLQGKAVPCLAITEPGAGSDVAAIKTTAEKSACGEFYVVNGEKKWITNGIFADYFTTAVRTGGSGMGGISLLLLQKGMEGLECRQMQCMGVWSSGTTFVTFDDVKVPVSALIGQENAGFKCIVNNFNHERFGFIAQATRFALEAVSTAEVLLGLRAVVEHWRETDLEAFKQTPQHTTSTTPCNFVDGDQLMKVIVMFRRLEITSEFTWPRSTNHTRQPPSLESL